MSDDLTFALRDDDFTVSLENDDSDLVILLPDEATEVSANEDFYVTVTNENEIHVSFAAVGVPGAGLPTGGTDGQILTKTGPTDYSYAWEDQVIGGFTSFEDLPIATPAQIRSGEPELVIGVEQFLDAIEPVASTNVFGTLAVDFDGFVSRVYTLIGNLTLGVTSNVKPGTSGMFEFVQGSVGGYTLAVNPTYWEINNVFLSSTVGARDYIPWYADASGKVIIGALRVQDDPIYDIEAELEETIYDTVAAILVQGANTTLTPNDTNNTLTIAATVGSGGVADLYEHVQSVASATWTVNHNFGRKAVISVLTVGGVEMWAEVTHTTVNQAVISFVSPVAGSALCV